MRYYKNIESGEIWITEFDWPVSKEFTEVAESDWRNYRIKNLPEKIFGLVVSATERSSFCKFWYASKGEVFSCSWDVAQATGFKVRNGQVIIPRSGMCPIHHALNGLPCEFQRIF